MKQLTEILTIRISKEDKTKLSIIEDKGIVLSKFARLAIKEKLQRDWNKIKVKKEKEYCPF